MNYKFTKATDKEHTETIDSNLIYAVWKSGVAYGGAEAKLEVKTSFVGQGAQIEITCKGDDYGNIKKIKDKINNNRYNGVIPIPEDITTGDNVWFEVKLSKQGLKVKSNIIPGRPKPEIVKMKWDKKEAQRGDDVRLQAELDRIEDEIEANVIIYEYDRDGNHDKIVTIPTTIKKKKLDLLWKYEYHEDVDEISTEEELQKYSKSYNPPEYFFVIVINGVRLGEKQESKLLTFQDTVEFVFQDELGKAVSNAKYEIVFADGKKKNGKAEADGKVSFDKIPPGPIMVYCEDI